jgi:hypothetical protein
VGGNRPAPPLSLSGDMQSISRGYGAVRPRDCVGSPRDANSALPVNGQRVSADTTGDAFCVPRMTPDPTLFHL